ncbi:hypothetical protein A9X80_00325 [Brachyspira hyodysenteriae]|uniref:hypothetical protein n=1 Tax=Brachyspira hyodysenteriae TaxID=159 RepID=UPI0011832BB5|nr:hypothetical protein [Brachyspira hyodysenteriae]TVL83496.1 hypothetical protein A9X80_00325 [Brachyspira hyodysenteriae]
MKENNSQNPYIYLEIDKTNNKIKMEDYNITTPKLILLLAEFLINFCKRKKKNTMQIVEIIVETMYKKHELENKKNNNIL